MNSLPFFRPALAVATLFLAASCAGSMSETETNANRSDATTAAMPAETPPAAPATAPETAPASETAATDAMAPEGMESMKAANKLLMSTEVQGITGRKVMSMPTAGNGVRFVEKSAAGDTSTVAFVTYTTPTMFDDTRTAAASKTTSGRISRVSGLGDAAYYDAGGNVLYVKAKEQVLEVGVPATLPGKDRRSVALQLGRLATARL